MKITQKLLLELPVKAAKKKKENNLFLAQIARRLPGKLDEAFHRLHIEVFEELDCLDCGNCCKSLGPRITDADIRRISILLKIKSSEFSKKYLKSDEDNDYVFRAMPCPFLDAKIIVKFMKPAREPAVITRTPTGAGCTRYSILR